MVMSMYTMLRNNPQPTEEEMEAALRGIYVYSIVKHADWHSFSLLAMRNKKENKHIS